MAQQFLQTLLVLVSPVCAQTLTYGTYTTLSLYSDVACPVGLTPISLTPTSANGNCTNLDNAYGLRVSQLGTGCNIKYFQKKNCPSDSFGQPVQPHVCNGLNGALIESVQLVDCENALPDSNVPSTTTSKTSVSTSPAFTTSGMLGSTTSSQSYTPTPAPSPSTPASGGSSNDNGLSTGAKIGIIAGAISAFAICAGVLVTCSCGGIGHVLTMVGMRRRRQQTEPPHTGSVVMTDVGRWDMNNSGNRAGRDYYGGYTYIQNYGRV